MKKVFKVFALKEDSITSAWDSMDNNVTLLQEWPSDLFESEFLAEEWLRKEAFSFTNSLNRDLQAVILPVWIKE